MLDTHILSWNHLAIEHNILRTVFFIICFYDSQYTLYKMQIVRIVINLHAQKFSGLYQSVNTNGQILAFDIDITGIKKRQHSMLLQLLKILIISKLNLVA